MWVCIRTNACMCAVAHVCKPEYHLWKLVLPFRYVGSGKGGECHAWRQAIFLATTSNLNTKAHDWRDLTTKVKSLLTDQYGVRSVLMKHGWECSVSLEQRVLAPRAPHVLTRATLVCELCVGRGRQCPVNGIGAAAEALRWSLAWRPF